MSRRKSGMRKGSNSLIKDFSPQERSSMTKRPLKNWTSKKRLLLIWLLTYKVVPLPPWTLLLLSCPRSIIMIRKFVVNVMLLFLQELKSAEKELAVTGPILDQERPLSQSKENNVVL